MEAASGMENLPLITPDGLRRNNSDHPLAVPSMSVELFRYRGAAKDGGTLEYVFEGDEQNSPSAITKEKAAEIAADFMTTFYHVQVGALETQEFRTAPIPFWLICFPDNSKRPRSSRSKGSGSFARYWITRTGAIEKDRP
jgi:hypothetical protein